MRGTAIQADTEGLPQVELIAKGSPGIQDASPTDLWRESVIADDEEESMARPNATFNPENREGKLDEMLMSEWSEAEESKEKPQEVTEEPSPTQIF